MKLKPKVTVMVLNTCLVIVKVESYSILKTFMKVGQMQSIKDSLHFLDKRSLPVNCGSDSNILLLLRVGKILKLPHPAKTNRLKKGLLFPCTNSMSQHRVRRKLVGGGGFGQQGSDGSGIRGLPLWLEGLVPAGCFWSNHVSTLEKRLKIDQTPIQIALLPFSLSLSPLVSLVLNATPEPGSPTVWVYV